MNRLTTLAACLLLASTAPAITACQTATPAVSHQTAERAMIDADTAYITIATVVAEGKASGVLVGDKAVTADRVQRDAWQALQVARAAYAANNAPNLVTLTTLLAQAQALVGVVK